MSAGIRCRPGGPSRRAAGNVAGVAPGAGTSGTRGRSAHTRGRSDRSSMRSNTTGAAHSRPGWRRCWRSRERTSWRALIRSYPSRCTGRGGARAGSTRRRTSPASFQSPLRHALRRTRRTPSQTDLPEAERYENVRGAFALRRRVDVSGAVIVVVDDVSTTGATLDACARVLLDAGAREVRALTAARVVSRRP